MLAAIQSKPVLALILALIVVMIILFIISSILGILFGPVGTVGINGFKNATNTYIFVNS